MTTGMTNFLHTFLKMDRETSLYTFGKKWYESVKKAQHPCILFWGSTLVHWENIKGLC